MTDATTGSSTELDSSHTTLYPASSNDSSNSVAAESSHPQSENFTKLKFGELECYIDQANRRAAPVLQVPIFGGATTVNDRVERHFRLTADLMNIQTEITELMLFLNTANALLARRYARTRPQHARISDLHERLTVWHEEMIGILRRQLRIHNDLLKNHTELAENHDWVGRSQLAAREDARIRRYARKKARKKEKKHEGAVKADLETEEQPSQRQATLSMNPSEPEENGNTRETSSGEGETMRKAMAPVEISEEDMQSLTMSLD